MLTVSFHLCPLHPAKPQCKIAPALAFLAATTLVSAHGHVTKWTIGGVDKAGFNPGDVNEFGPTAERPTDNADQG
jgi:hypothetical protein